KPIVRNLTLSEQKTIEGRHQFGMCSRRYFPIVRNLTHIPQSPDRDSAVGKRAHLLVAGCVFEHQNVFGDRRAREARMRRQRRERSSKRPERGKIEVRAAPLQYLNGLETVAFKCMNEFGVEWCTASGGAEAAVAACPASAPGNLGEFSRIEATELIAVELAVRCKCH